RAGHAATLDALLLLFLDALGDHRDIPTAAGTTGCTTRGATTRSTATAAASRTARELQLLALELAGPVGLDLGALDVPRDVERDLGALHLPFLDFDGTGYLRILDGSSEFLALDLENECHRVLAGHALPLAIDTGGR